jgi:Skp family chaperone for outer membrane proteins
LNAREIKARADAQEKRNQKYALLQASRTEAEIEEARLKKRTSEQERLANRKQAELDRLLEAPEELELALAKKEETRVGKSDGGKNSSKYSHYERRFSS